MDTHAKPGKEAIETRSDRSTTPEWHAKRARYVSNAVSAGTSVIASRAQGAELWDVEGKRYVDFAGGIGTLNVGHAHPKVVEAISTQALRLTHSAFSVVAYEPYIALAETLAGLTPGTFPKKSVFVNSGAEAVENALKIARAATGRPLIICFEHAFHGRTLLTMALTHKTHPYKEGFGPFPQDILRLPQPYLYRPHYSDEVQGCLRALDDALTQHAGQVAAILFEPVQGEGGFIVAPPTWVEGVARLAERHGVILIADEVQTGFGRTGRWFAVEHTGITPDLVVMAKSLAGGLPLGAVTGRAELLDQPVPGGLGGTFGGNPIACAAALAVIDVIRDERLIDQAIEIGGMVTARFRAWQQRYPLVGDVRGLGAMVAMELVRDRDTKEPAAQETGTIVSKAADRGLILIRAGMLDNVIRSLVPLVATDDQITEGLDILEQCLAEVQSTTTA